MTRQRARDVLLLLPSLIVMAPVIIAMFLTDLWVARRDLLSDVAAHRP